MRLRIERQELPDKTPGELLVDDKHFAWTLEDKSRGNDPKVYGETCIPYGTYRVILSYSNRFGKRMIQLINMRGGNIMFGDKPIDQCGIRMHGGNTTADTLGCPLFGADRKPNFDIYNCNTEPLKLNDKLIALVEAADKKGEVYIDIVKRPMAA